jgi:hypothetical protein
MSLWKKLAKMWPSDFVPQRIHTKKLLKSCQKIVATSRIFKKNCPKYISIGPTNGRKFAQSGHPDEEHSFLVKLKPQQITCLDFFVRKSCVDAKKIEVCRRKERFFQHLIFLVFADICHGNYCLDGKITFLTPAG